MEYPVPTHLKNILKVNDYDQSNLYGSVVCPCGCDIFRIYHNEDREFDDTLPYNEQYGLKFKAECTKCGAVHLIFDQAVQGYDGLVCGDCKSAPDDTLHPLTCKKCGTDRFELDIYIEVEDKEQFIEECVSEYTDKFTPDDYVDAFDWITITTTCDKCGDVDEWVSLELS